MTDDAATNLRHASRVGTQDIHLLAVLCGTPPHYEVSEVNSPTDDNGVLIGTIQDTGYGWEALYGRRDLAMCDTVEEALAHLASRIEGGRYFAWFCVEFDAYSRTSDTICEHDTAEEAAACDKGNTVKHYMYQTAPAGGDIWTELDGGFDKQGALSVPMEVVSGTWRVNLGDRAEGMITFHRDADDDPFYLATVVIRQQQNQKRFPSLEDARKWIATLAARA